MSAADATRAERESTVSAPSYTLSRLFFELLSQREEMLPLCLEEV